MKINSGSIHAVNAYVHAAGEIRNKKISEDRSKKNTDKVEFSNAAKAAVGISSASAKSRSEALAAAKNSASPEKIAALKAAVENGGYYVRSEDIVSSILGF